MNTKQKYNFYNLFIHEINYIESNYVKYDDSILETVNEKDIYICKYLQLQIKANEKIKSLCREWISKNDFMKIKKVSDMFKFDIKYSRNEDYFYIESISTNIIKTIDIVNLKYKLEKIEKLIKELDSVECSKKIYDFNISINEYCEIYNSDLFKGYIV